MIDLLNIEVIILVFVVAVLILVVVYIIRYALSTVGDDRPDYSGIDQLLNSNTH